MEVMYCNIKSPFIEEIFEPANDFGLRFYVSVNNYGHVETLHEILSHRHEILSNWLTSKVQVSLLIYTVSSEPLSLSFTKYGCR